MRNTSELLKAKSIIQDFCELNGIDTPKIVEDLLMKDAGQFRHGTPNVLFYNRKNVNDQVAVRKAGAFLKDLTVCGTILHEFGHFLDFRAKHKLRKSFVRLKEPMVHYHEMLIEEDVAESLRLYVCNPMILKHGRPSRFKAISKHFASFPKSNAIGLTKNMTEDDWNYLNKWNQLVY